MTGLLKGEKSQHRRRVNLSLLCAGLFWITVPLQAADSPADPVGPGAASPSTTSEVYAAARDAVVLVKTEDGTGAGFLVKGQRLIATAFHVVSNGGTVRVQTRDGKVHAARLYNYDRKTDLALLELEEALVHVQPLPLRTSSLPTIGEVVVVIGHPFGAILENDDDFKGLLTWTVTSGVIGAISEGVLQTDAAINPGNSGGPLLDGRGQVLGVVSSQLRDASNVGFAVRVEQLEELIERPLRAPPLLVAPVKRLGLGLGRTSTLEGLWMGGVSGHYERRPRGSGMRRGLSIGYAFVNEMPSDGQLFNFREDYYWVQYDLGYHLERLKLDLLAGLNGGWQWQQSIRAQATPQDPTCIPSEQQECVLDVTFLTDRKNSAKVFGVAGLKLTQLLGVMDVGVGMRVDVFGEPLIRWHLWVEFLDRT